MDLEIQDAWLVSLWAGCLLDLQAFIAEKFVFL